jgi:gluconokinase
MVGTSGAMRVAIRGKAPRNIPSGLWCYRIDRERVVVGGALSDGGGLYDWLDENFKLPTNARLAIAKSLPDKHGLTFLPFLSGERSTGYNENASGAIIGITSYTKPADVAAAAMESIAFRFAEIFEQLNKVTKIKEIDASGGALKASGVWTQIIADILGREIKMAAAPEASLRGAVLLALESIGNIENINTVTSDSPYLIVPNMRNHMIYSAARSRHQHFYDLIINNR